MAGNGGGVACSRTAPCASFQVAHNATDPGGIIKCVDAGSFSIATITKSITIDCTGTNGGSVNGLSNAIAVDGVDVVVTLRGLSIDGLGTGTAGVRFVNGSALHIQNCSISGSTQAGILFARSAAGTAKLHVSDSVLSNNGVGILIEASGSGSVRGMLTRVQVENNSLQGITASGLGGNGSIVVQVTVLWPAIPGMAFSRARRAAPPCLPPLSWTATPRFSIAGTASGRKAREPSCISATRP